MTVALLLGLGGVLIARELLGVWVTFGVGVGVVLAGYTALLAIRELTIWRLRRRIRRW